MLHRILSVWVWFRSDYPGFCLGTSLLITLMLLMYTGGIQACLSVGPGGDPPRVIDVFLYAFSHDELSSLLISVALLLVVGRCQERRWGTVAFLALSALTMTILPLLYTLVLFVIGGEATRICGYSAIQLALFTAQCRQVTQRRLLRCLPVWFLPWLLLLIGLLLLPQTPALLHFCTICIGHNFSCAVEHRLETRYLFNGSHIDVKVGDHQSFIATMQELEEVMVFDFIPDWAYVPISARFRLPTYTTSKRSTSLPQRIPGDQAAATSLRDASDLNHHPWVETVPAWTMNGSAEQSESEVLEEQMLRAGILASLQDAPENPDAKVEVPKSSVSSLRLQQLEKMGFPTEKAVVALAASKQLDGAISLLIDDSVGEQAVVVSKGKLQNN